MSHYTSNLRDISFNLFEVFGTGRRLGLVPYEDLDHETVSMVLAEVERLASGPFSDSFVDGDRTPPTLDATGEVTLPPAISAALDAYFAGGWGALDLPRHLGGMGAPRSVAWACSSMLAGANPAVLMYAGGPFFAALADELVTDAQRERWIVPWVERQWGGTMVLTEPEAGSDVGAARTTATDGGDDVWHLTGTKRFITNGDFDWPENIIHLVLARAVDAEGIPLHGAGTKGLSLFLVPKQWSEVDGSLGERNAITVTAIEDKMGLKASATCELTLDGARGVLVGDVHDGIRQMFKVIEYARMLVGVKAIETLSTGYLNALAYAKERIQGTDLHRMGDKDAARVAIIRHPDVRRILMTLKAHAEGLRALVFLTASVQDEIEVARATGADTRALAARNELLLPLVKGYGSERSYALLADALQVLGGSGYCKDHPFEQYLRDAKIDTLYEGTTAIQGLDLYFRKVARDDGAALGALLDEVAQTAAGREADALAAERVLLSAAVDDLRAIVEDLAKLAHRDVNLAGLQATGFLTSVAEVLIGWLLVRQAEVALTALDDGPGDAEVAFYRGKVAAAQWFCATVLPQLTSRRTMVAATDGAVMDLDDAAF